MPFAGQMSEVEDGSDGAFETAIAAAAYAITFQEEKNSWNQERSVEKLGSPLTNTKSKREESKTKLNDSSKISRWLSGKKENKDRKSSVSDDGSIRKSATLGQRLREDSAADHKIKKTPTFSDNYLNETGSQKFDSGQKQGEQQAPSARKPPASFSGKGNASGKRTDSTMLESKADAWEKAKMAKIKRRYEKTNVAVLEWENEKVMKAKRRLGRKEREQERRRERALQEYRNEMSRIAKICGGARAAADERKRNDQYKAMEKAKTKRSTRKVPHACPCL